MGQAAGGLAQGVSRGGRQREQQLTRRHVTAYSVVPWCGRGSLFENGVHVGARHAIRRDGRAPRRCAALAWPGCNLLWHKEFGIDPGELIGEPGEVRHRRHQAMLQRQDGFDQSHHTRCGLGMTQIALGRRQGAGSVDAVNACQAFEFDRITNGGAGAVRLDHADGAGVDTGRRQRRAIRHHLRIQGRGGNVLGASVLIRCGASQHGQDPVAVARPHRAAA